MSVSPGKPYIAPINVTPAWQKHHETWPQVAAKQHLRTFIGPHGPLHLLDLSARIPRRTEHGTLEQCRCYRCVIGFILVIYSTIPTILGVSILRTPPMLLGEQECRMEWWQCLVDHLVHSSIQAMNVLNWKRLSWISAYWGLLAWWNNPGSSHPSRDWVRRISIQKAWVCAGLCGASRFQKLQYLLGKETICTPLYG